jgi:thioredoxin 1
MPIDSVLHTNSQSIDRVLRTGLPLLLVFWGRHAPQSNEFDALLDKLAAQFAGRALIAKVEAGDEADLVKRYAIQLLPSLVAIKGGRVEATLPGRVAPSVIEAWLAYLVNGGAQPPLARGEGVPLSGARPQPTSNGGAAARPTGQHADRHTAVAPVTATDAGFDQLIHSDLPVLVDFWAEWCGPCRMVGPSVDTLAREFAGRAIVAKLNVDQNPQTARRYNIMSIPALLIFQQGKVVDQIIGVQPLPVLRQKLARFAGT